MEDTYKQLAEKICSSASEKQPERLLVGIAGPPGSGKSTVAENVMRLINQDPANATTCKSQVVSMDGFHYSRQFLDKLPNKEEAYVRRGAPWTFDVDAIVKFISKLAETATRSAADRPKILGPSFDHALKDPLVDSVEISPETSVVILDGNYLLLDEDKWRDISHYLDLKVFVKVEPNIARERVGKRHVTAGIEPTIAKGLERFDTNDKINGDLIRSNVLSYDIAIAGG